MDALSRPQPQVNVLDYLLNPPSNVTETNGPGLLLYLLNIFAKAIISQFLDETSGSPATANPIGIAGLTIFAQVDLMWNGIPMSDILLAKFHKACPVLFGVYGDENTSKGKERIGWSKDEGGFVTSQRHSERMTGLGRGFAALTLRKINPKSPMVNVFPPRHFWKAFASIVNVPADAVMPTHYLVLRAMIEHHIKGILTAFGNVGIVALRKAIIEFPQQSRISDSVAARSLALLRDTLGNEQKLWL